MLRDMSFSHFLGAGGFMDIWVIAFQIPNLSRRLFGEGAASASFIPVYRQEIETDPQGAKKLANTVVTVIFVLLSAIVLAGWCGIWIYRSFFVTNPETVMMLNLVSTMLPYMIMICVVAILAGILNVHGHFAAPAAAPIILNVFIITSIILVGSYFNVPPSQQLFFVAATVLAAGLVQIAVQISPLRSAGVSIRPAWEVNSDAFKKIMILMAPMIIGLTVTQMNTLLDMWIAKFFSGSAIKGEFFTMFGTSIRYPMWEGSVSYLYYAQRLYQLPLGVFGIALATAIFPVMSKNAANKDYDNLCENVSHGLKGAAFIAIPAMIGLILVARPLISVLFEHGEFTASDTAQTSRTLWFYALGLCGFFTQQIITRAFYSMQDSKMPMTSAIIAVFVNIILNLILIWFMGVAGLALSTAICSYLQVAILVFVLRKRLGDSLMAGFAVIFTKTLIATAVMTLIGWLCLHLLSTLGGELIIDIVRLIVVVPASVAGYIIVSIMLKNPMISLINSRKNI